MESIRICGYSLDPPLTGYPDLVRGDDAVNWKSFAATRSSGAEIGKKSIRVQRVEPPVPRFCKQAS